MDATRAEKAAMLGVEAFSKNSQRAIDLGTVIAGMLGMTNKNGSPAMTDLELRNPVEFLLLNQLAQVVRASLPVETSKTLEKVGISAVAKPPAAPDHSKQVNDLLTELADLKDLIAGQQKKIKALEQRKGKPNK